MLWDSAVAGNPFTRKAPNENSYAIIPKGVLLRTNLKQHRY